jgi:hypothetical protein
VIIQECMEEIILWELVIIHKTYAKLKIEIIKENLMELQKLDAI